MAYYRSVMVQTLPVVQLTLDLVRRSKVVLPARAGVVAGYSTGTSQHEGGVTAMQHTIGRVIRGPLSHAWNWLLKQLEESWNLDLRRWYW